MRYIRMFLWYAQSHLKLTKILTVKLDKDNVLLEASLCSILIFVSYKAKLLYGSFKLITP